MDDRPISRLMADAVRADESNLAPVMVAMADLFGERETATAMIRATIQPEDLLEYTEGEVAAVIRMELRGVREEDILYWMYHNREEGDGRDPVHYVALETERRVCRLYLRDVTSMMGAGMTEGACDLARNVAGALRRDLSALSSHGASFLDAYADRLDEYADMGEPERGFVWTDY